MLAAALLVAAVPFPTGGAPDDPAGGPGEGPPAAAADNAAAEPPPEPGPPPVETEYVRLLAAGEPGSNDANPAWSPDGRLVAFERTRGDRREIVVARPGGGAVATVYHLLPGNEAFLPFPLPGGDGTSFNAGAAWSPGGDRLLFMSNGGEGNYDIYLREMGDGSTLRLTEHREKDGQPHWSPARENLIVFVSGRTGRGDLYLMNLWSRTPERLTGGDDVYLHPRFSPDGRRIAATRGENGNHDVCVIDLGPGGGTVRPLTLWPWDDIRPAWSPDGRRVAFYTNFDAAGGTDAWGIAVVDAAGSDPREGEGLAARIVARDVVPDVESGPAWTPDGAGIVFVKNERRAYNPIYVADVATKVERPVLTETKMNHDVACAPDGRIAFRAQVDQWDRLFVAKMRKEVSP